MRYLKKNFNTRNRIILKLCWFFLTVLLRKYIIGFNRVHSLFVERKKGIFMEREIIYLEGNDGIEKLARMAYNKSLILFLAQASVYVRLQLMV